MSDRLLSAGDFMPTKLNRSYEYKGHVCRRGEAVNHKE